MTSPGDCPGKGIYASCNCASSTRRFRTEDDSQPWLILMRLCRAFKPQRLYWMGKRGVKWASKCDSHQGVRMASLLSLSLWQTVAHEMNAVNELWKLAGLTVTSQVVNHFPNSFWIVNSTWISVACPKANVGRCLWCNCKRHLLTEGLLEQARLKNQWDKSSITSHFRWQQAFLSTVFQSLRQNLHDKDTYQAIWHSSGTRATSSSNHKVLRANRFDYKHWKVNIHQKLVHGGCHLDIRPAAYDKRHPH